MAKTHDGGSLQSLIMLDFRNKSGILVIATRPTNLDPMGAEAAARTVYANVVNAERADYDVYADGRFDWETTIKKELTAIDSTIITYDDSLF